MHQVKLNSFMLESSFNDNKPVESAAPANPQLDELVDLRRQLAQAQEELNTSKLEQAQMQLTVQALQRTFEQGRNLTLKIFDDLPAMLLVLDAEGKCILINQNFTNFLKADPILLLGRDAATFFLRPEHFRHTLNKVQKRGKVQNYSLPVLNPDLLPIESYWNINLIHEVSALYSGEKLGYVCIGILPGLLTDFNLQAAKTNRRLALLNRLNERIHSSNDLQTVLQNVVEEVGTAMRVDSCLLAEIIINAEKQQSFTNYIFYAKNNEAQKEPQQLIEIPQIKEILESGKAVIIPDTTLLARLGVKITKKSESKFPRSLLGIPVKDGEEQIAILGIGYSEIAHEWAQDEIELLREVGDLIGKAIVEARLFSQVEQERAKSAVLLASMAEGVLALDSSGYLININPAAILLLGLKNEQILGQPAAVVLPAVLETQRNNYRVEINERVMAIMSSEIRDEQGGKVILIRDVTEEARVEKLKEDFITLVSHEFRTPVTAITGALEILTDEETGPLNDIQRDFLRVASSNTERIRQIMNDVIDVSTIQGGHLVLDLSPVLLSDVLNRANTGQIADLQERKKIVVETDLSAAPRVFGDPRRIVQIFANLISNAYKYTPEGGKVTITSKPEQENMVRISIADTGIGLSTTERTHLGEKFYRVDNSLIREISGTGLGLAITKALVELHNGRLEVSSTPGAGSIFSVLLPHKGTNLPAYNLSDYLAPDFNM